MTIVALTDQQLDLAYAVSAEIGATIRAARHARHERAEDTASACDTHATTVRAIERGVSPNVKLGSAIKLLAHFGMTLTVVPLGRDP